MSDDRWTEEQKAAHEAAKAARLKLLVERMKREPRPTNIRSGGRAVSAEEIAEFVKELEKK